MCIVKINGNWMDAIKLVSDVDRNRTDGAPDHWVVRFKKEDGSEVDYAIQKKIVEGYDEKEKPVFSFRDEPEFIKQLRQNKITGRVK